MEAKIPTYVSLISSSISGGIHIIVGHPFDTIKNILQGKNTFNYSGILQLYRGLKYPLLQNTFSNSVTFGFNNYFNNITNKFSEISFRLNQVLHNGDFETQPYLEIDIVKAPNNQLKKFQKGTAMERYIEDKWFDDIINHLLSLEK